MPKPSSSPFDQICIALTGGAPSDFDGDPVDLELAREFYREAGTRATLDAVTAETEKLQAPATAPATAPAAVERGPPEMDPVSFEPMRPATAGRVRSTWGDDVASTFGFKAHPQIVRAVI